jgi:hypothetical protein
VVLTILPSSVSRLSRRCGGLDDSQPHGPSQPVTGIALPFFTFISMYLMLKHNMTSPSEALELELSQRLTEVTDGYT